MRQQRLLRRLRRLREQRTAMTVGCRHKASGHVVAEERDSGGVAAVRHRQRAADDPGAEVRAKDGFAAATLDGGAGRKACGKNTLDAAAVDRGADRLAGGINKAESRRTSWCQSRCRRMQPPDRRHC